MNKSVAIIAGEHGTEVMQVAMPVLEAVGNFDYLTSFGSPTTREHFPGLPPGAIKLAQDSDAVLLGHIDGPEEVSTDSKARQPDTHIRELQKAIGAHVVVQPVVAFETLAAQSPLKNDRIDGTDLVIVHALGDFYWGDKDRYENGFSYDEGAVTLKEIKDIGRTAFDLAVTRAAQRGEATGFIQVPSVTSVDKANVLETSRLWRETMGKLQREEYPEIDLENLLADNAAMEMVSHPANYDVIVSNNIFGDILAGEVSAITNPALIPSASLNKQGQGIYHPARPESIRSAPAIIMSLAQMLRHSLDMPEAAQDVEGAVELAFDSGAITPALGGRTSDQEFAEEVVKNLRTAP